MIHSKIHQDPPVSDMDRIGPNAHILGIKPGPPRHHVVLRSEESVRASGGRSKRWPITGDIVADEIGEYRYADDVTVENPSFPPESL